MQGWALALPQSFTVFKVQWNWSPEGVLGVSTALGTEGPDPPCALGSPGGILLGVSRAGVEGMGRGQGITLCSLTEGWLCLQMFTLDRPFFISLSPSLLYFKDRSESVSQVTLLQAAAYVCQFCALSVK